MLEVLNPTAASSRWWRGALAAVLLAGVTAQAKSPAKPAPPPPPPPVVFSRLELFGKDARSASRLTESCQGERVKGGYKLVVGPTCLFTRLGLKSGDVLRSINGIALVDPDAVLDAYLALKSASRVEVGYQRGAKQRTAVAELTD